MSQLYTKILAFSVLNHYTISIKGIEMKKYSAIVLILFLSFSTSLADTFTHMKSGNTFNGYAIMGRKKGIKRQVRIFHKSPQYLNLSDYRIERNLLGRKKLVHVFNIDDSINLISQTLAFEKAITQAANQGPLFILITIDSPGMRADLAQRICSAITKIDNCDTVAFVNGGKFGGAFAEVAIIALACDKVFMHKISSIGAGGFFIPDPAGSKGINNYQIQVSDANSQLSWKYYSVQIAELKDRPVAIVKAMQDDNIELIEVAENGKSLFIDSRDKKSNQKVIRTVSEKGQLFRLTPSQALQYGITDKVVPSQQDMLKTLEADKARQVRDNSLLKAKRRFGRVKKTMDRLISFIDPLEEQAKAIVTEIELIETEIDRRNDVFLREQFGIVRRNVSMFHRPGPDIFELERLVIYHDELLRELLDIYGYLIRNYRRAVPLAREHPDLNQNLQSLEESLNTAETKFEELQIRIRLSY